MKLRRITASVVGLATLIAGFGMTAATATADTATVSDTDLAKPVPLSVKSTGKDISSNIFEAVQLGRYTNVQTDGTNITGYDVNDTQYASAIDTALKAASIDTTKSAGDVYDANNPISWVAQNLLDSSSSPYAGSLRDFLDQLRKQPTIINATGGTVSSLETVNGDATTSSGHVSPGIYMIRDETASGEASIVMMNGTGVYYGSNLLTTLKSGTSTYDLGEVNFKGDSTDGPPIKKIVTSVDDADHASISDDGTVVKAELGSTMSFKVTTIVPNWTGYDSYYYAINDSYSKGLYLDMADAEGQSDVADAVSVSVNGSKLVYNTDYRVVNDSANRSMKIVFVNGKSDATQADDIIPNKSKLPVGSTVEVTYKMTTIGGTGAAVAGESESNVAKVEWSQNPSTTGDHAITDDGDGGKVTVYTGVTRITKKNMNNNYLPGAEFEIYKKGSDTPMGFRRDENDSIAYRPVTTTDGQTESAQTIVTPNEGVIDLVGLSGEYVIKETKSPYKGAILPTFTITVTIADNGTYSTALTEGDANRLVTLDDDTAGVTVRNAKSILTMPKSGAVWLTIFMGAGLLLIGAGAMFLIRGRMARDQVKETASGSDM